MLLVQKLLQQVLFLKQFLLDNLFGYEKITIQLNEEKIEQEVFDYSKYYSDLVINTFSNVLEILVFVHNKTSNWWQGVRTVKYITWSYALTPDEIYNINEAPSQPSQLRWEKKKLYITPYRSNMIVDIFLLKLPATIIR